MRTNKNVLTAEKFGKILGDAYTVYFDLDDLQVLRCRGLWPPSYAHLYYICQLTFSYKGKIYVIYHKFFYSKIPSSQRRGLSYEEWGQMLRTTGKFKKVRPNVDVLKTRNVQTEFSFSVYTHEEEILGGKEHLYSITEVLQEVKKIIDRLPPGDETEPEPSKPKPPGKLQPVSETINRSEFRKILKELILEEINRADLTARTEHFSVKFGEPGLGRETAKILLGNEWFANSYRIEKGFGWQNMKEGEWIVNKHEGAFRLRLPSWNKSYPTLQNLLEDLERWYANQASREGIKEITMFRSPSGTPNTVIEVARIIMANLEAADVQNPNEYVKIEFLRMASPTHKGWSIKNPKGNKSNHIYYVKDNNTWYISTTAKNRVGLRIRSATNKGDFFVIHILKDWIRFTTHGIGDILKENLICEELNNWGGWVIQGPHGATATVSIWKVPGIWKKDDQEHYFYDKSQGYRYNARIDFKGRIEAVKQGGISSHNGATVHVVINDNDPECNQFGYRDARTREELYPYIKNRLELQGFPTEGIENARTKLSLSAWSRFPDEYAVQPEYNPEDHLGQAKFIELLNIARNQAQYRINHPEEFPEDDDDDDDDKKK